MAWQRPRAETPRDRKKLFRAAVLSGLAHALLLLAILTFVPAPTVELPREVIEVTLGPLAEPSSARARAAEAPLATPGALPVATLVPASTTAVTATPQTPAVAAGGARATPTPAKRAGDGRVVTVSPGVSGMIDEHFRRERESFGENPNDGGPHDPRMLRPGATVTDQLDGIADLGSGEPGDPRIPGAGPVDIGKVLTRDAVVASSREHTAEGRVPQFLCDVKNRIEKEWDPSPRDASVLSDPERIADPVCDAGYHLRFKVARVLAVYDATGARVSFNIVGATQSRNLHDRIARALDSAGMKPPPPDLLDGEGNLRLAWNVFVDSYAGCHLVGTDGRGKHADGGAFTVGIVELDGVY